MMYRFFGGQLLGPKKIYWYGTRWMMLGLLTKHTRHYKDNRRISGEAFEPCLLKLMVQKVLTEGSFTLQNVTIFRSATATDGEYGRLQKLTQMGQPRTATPSEFQDGKDVELDAKRM